MSEYSESRTFSFISIAILIHGAVIFLIALYPELRPFSEGNDTESIEFSIASPKGEQTLSPNLRKDGNEELPSSELAAAFAKAEVVENPAIEKPRLEAPKVVVAKKQTPKPKAQAPAAASKPKPASKPIAKKPATTLPEKTVASKVETAESVPAIAVIESGEASEETSDTLPEPSDEPTFDDVNIAAATPEPEPLKQPELVEELDQEIAEAEDTASDLIESSDDPEYKAMMARLGESEDEIPQEEPEEEPEAASSITPMTATAGSAHMPQNNNLQTQHRPEAEANSALENSSPNTAETQKPVAKRSMQTAPGDPRATPTGRGSNRPYGVKNGVQDARHLRQIAGNPKPIYPERDRLARHQGSVHLLYDVTSNGRVRNVRVIKSSGFKTLDQSAVKAVSRYRYYPGQAGLTVHPIYFRLKGPAQERASRLRTSMN